MTNRPVQSFTLNDLEVSEQPVLPRRLEAAVAVVESGDIQESVRMLVIRDQQTYDGAVSLRRAVKALRAEAERVNRPLIASAYETHRKACARLKDEDGPLEEAERKISRLIANWDDEQRKKADEEARRIKEEAARKQAEEFEAELRAAELAGASKEEVKALIVEEEARPLVLPAKPAPVYQAAKGVSVSATYSAAVTSMKMLLAHLIEHPEYINLVKIDQPALDRMARTMKENFKLPGCQLMKSSTVRDRG